MLYVFRFVDTNRQKGSLDASSFSSVQGQEHLLSDLEATVLVLLAHGAPLSIDLGEDTAEASHATRSAAQPVAALPYCSATFRSKHGCSVGQAGTGSSGGPSTSAGSSHSASKWWLPAEVPVEVRGDGRALVAACACNSWPLVAAVLALIPAEACLHKVSPPAVPCMFQSCCNHVSMVVRL